MKDKVDLQVVGLDLMVICVFQIQYICLCAPVQGVVVGRGAIWLEYPKQ